MRWGTRGSATAAIALVVAIVCAPTNVSAGPRAEGPARDQAGWQPKGSIRNIGLRPDGTPGGKAWDPVAISLSGRYVAFASNDRRLDSGGLVARPGRNVYLHDRTSGTTQLVNVTPAGEPAGPETLDHGIDVSNAGEVVFESGADDLVAGDANGDEDVFVRDRSSGTTALVSVTADGIHADDDSRYAAISDDGRFVAFLSYAGNLVGEVFDRRQALVRDMSTGSIRLASRSIDGGPSNDSTETVGPAIAPDGSAVGFVSDATDLVERDPTRKIDVFVYRLADDTVMTPIRQVDGHEHRNSAGGVDFDATGTAVYFGSDLSTLVPGDDTRRADVFRFDLGTETTTLISQTRAGEQGDDDSYHPAVSGDGKYVAFDTYADNLAPTRGARLAVVKRLG